jgi:tRNA (guanine-N7-)-methyltransferase
MRRLRSFVRRGGRGTTAQVRAQHLCWPSFGLEVVDGLLNFQQVFDRQASCFLEIGFGSGESLLALAKLHPEQNFIGVETHKPGIGTLFLGMQRDELTNIRVYDADVVDVLAQCLPDDSLDGVQIFFPDPWPKRRHQPRRLIQADFIKKLIRKLKIGGVLHLATDWDDYATQMMDVLSSERALQNLAGVNQFSARSSQRPVVTKFERRALREGRVIRDLQFEKLDNPHPLT